VICGALAAGGFRAFLAGLRISPAHWRALASERKRELKRRLVSDLAQVTRFEVAMVGTPGLVEFDASTTDLPTGIPQVVGWLNAAVGHGLTLAEWFYANPAAAAAHPLTPELGMWESEACEYWEHAAFEVWHLNAY
jgi:hypothetical protein